MAVCEPRVQALVTQAALIRCVMVRCGTIQLCLLLNNLPSMDHRLVLDWGDPQQ